MRQRAKVDANQAYNPLCLQCGKLKGSTVHQLRQKYCSKECMAAAYKIRLKDNLNPNYKGIQPKICKICGCKYRSYSNKSKYCSRRCSGKSRIEHLKKISILGVLAPKEKRPRIIKYISCIICGNKFVKNKSKTCSMACGYNLRKSHIKKDKVPNKKCRHCGEMYHSYNKDSIYCSYKCSISHGTSFKAGLASRMARMKYGAKKDANHNIIIEYLRKGGIAVYDLSSVGCGIPDCIAWAHDGWHFIEIKNPGTAYGKRGLNKIQKKWAERWEGGPVFILSTIDDAEEFRAGNFNKLKVFPNRGSNRK